MNDLNDRIVRLRTTRVRIRKNIEAARLIGDRCDRDRRIHDLTLALRSTEPEWRVLQAELEARGDRVALAQLKHQRLRPAAAPVRRSAVPYMTRMLGGR